MLRIVDLRNRASDQTSHHLTISPVGGISVITSPEEFRREAVELVRSSDRSVNEIAKDLGYAYAEFDEERRVSWHAGA